ncbi:hypothetical protein ZHAS_00006325 [Anopheles sinensis]|uniref:Uncharacterized protein n=1 Tax=Anopheles sinensis TaxID=74873 RepID=A0A084VLJ5_ANOSI|nr:hypothetical protein ZHAS_00006325 [Anopheles sinensis]
MCLQLTGVPDKVHYRCAFCRRVLRLLWWDRWLVAPPCVAHRAPPRQVPASRPPRTCPSPRRVRSLGRPCQPTGSPRRRHFLRRRRRRTAACVCLSALIVSAAPARAADGHRPHSSRRRRPRAALVGMLAAFRSHYRACRSCSPARCDLLPNEKSEKDTING